MTRFKFTFLIFCLNIFFSQLWAQTSEIKEIKQHYYAVSEQIKNCSKEEVELCTIYRNDLIINSNGERTINWPATGNYIKKITFWYELAPAHWDENGKSALLKIDYSEVYSSNSDNYEFLYKNGYLVFCFYRQKNIGDFRYYFSNGKLIDYIENTEIEEDTGKKKFSSEIMEQAENLQKLFLTMF